MNFTSHLPAITASHFTDTEAHDLVVVDDPVGRSEVVHEARIEVIVDLREQKLSF